jgi:parallel beta-helix repeat protein
MNNLSLENVSLEIINSCWDENDEGVNKMNSLYIGELDKSRVMKDYFLNISVYSGSTLVEYKNLSWGECYPYHVRTIFPWKVKTIKEENIPIYNNFCICRPGNQMELGYTHYSETYKVHETIYDIPIDKIPWLALLPKYKGYIAIDAHPDAFPNFPPQNDHKLSEIPFDNQGFNVNKSIGNWIESKIEDDYTVKASYYTRWKREDVVSYNVLGQINGTDLDKVSIVCAHYDAVWNQGSIDEAAETALILGIAKYIKDHELESDLKHIVKFIAFGAEEVGMRGSKDYLKKHVLPDGSKEEIVYVINPGNFGSYNRTGEDYDGNKITMDFEPASDQQWLAELSENITKALVYTQRSNLTGPGYIQVEPEIGLRAEDSKMFGAGKTAVADACIQFGRSPFWGYHRDGDSHTAGDVFGGLDKDTFDLESEVVTSVALHLLLDLDYQFENCSFKPFDLDGDGNNDSVNVTVNMTTNNNATLFGKSFGGLYDNSSGVLSSVIKETYFQPLSKGNITSINLTLVLSPSKPEGYYKANISLYDPLNELHEECNQTFYLYPINRPGSDFSITQSSSKSFSFDDDSVPSPSGKAIASWNWSFGDGTYSTLENPSHNYTNNGTYNVTLTVVDKLGLNDSFTQSVTATNVGADVSISLDTEVELVNNSVGFVSSSSDPDGEIVNTTWLFGDGSIGYGEEIQHSYSSSGRYIVILSETDNDGATNSTTIPIIITNAYANSSLEEFDSETNSYPIIQDAFDNTSSDGVIYTISGDYSDGLTLDKPMKLYGEGENAIISASQTAVCINNDSILMDGFTITNAAIGLKISSGFSNITISNCNFLNSTTGVKFEANANENIISNCNFTNNTYGVYIDEAEHNIIGTPENLTTDDCIFTLNSYGVYLDSARDNYIMGCTINATVAGGESQTSGIFLDNSEYNTILMCDIYNASYYGIYHSGADDNTILNNIIRDNDMGVYLSGSSDNMIIGNNISDNSKSGVNILTASSKENIILFNDFINNGQSGQGTYPQASDSGEGNIWNTSDNNTYLFGGVGEGNNWSDYSGNDSDCDGIGDTAYTISGTAEAQDSYPVMEAYGWLYKWY